MPFRVNFQGSAFETHVFHGVLAIFFVAAVFSVDYFYDQKDFYAFFPIYTLAFVSLMLLYKSSIPLHYLLVIGIISRISMIFIFPGLSDDIYRFFWDGKLINSGFSPYGILPSEVLAKNLPYLDHTLLNLLNSKPYYTIYPPVSQLYFAASSWFGDLKVAVIIMKILFLFSESIGLQYIFKLLKKFNLTPRLAYLYFLNPLIIIEGIGNLHFEVIMISFLSIGIYYIFNKNLLVGAFWMSVSIGVKLLPLMILPYLWLNLHGKDRLFFFGGLVFFSGIIFIPMANGIEFTSFLSSVDLYFRKFEFNASVYYVFRFIGQQIFEYNLIYYVGPLLGLTVLAYNFYRASKEKIFSLNQFIKYALIVWTIYLFLATTVHPWYVCSLVFLGLFSSARYTMVWSYLIFLSYVNYSHGKYFENLWWIAFEYLVVFGVFLLDIRKNKY